jgi:hypothetical protein
MWETPLCGELPLTRRNLRNRKSITAHPPRRHGDGSGHIPGIHYNARLGGKNFAPDEELPYALVVSVHAKHLGDLYGKIVRKYARQLEAQRPVVEIPVSVGILVGPGIGAVCSHTALRSPGVFFS